VAVAVVVAVVVVAVAAVAVAVTVAVAATVAVHRVIMQHCQRRLLWTHPSSMHGCMQCIPTRTSG
jgi:hypothetical protein